MSSLFQSHILCLFLLLYNSDSVEIFDDPMDSSSASYWTYGGNALIPSSASQCSPQDTCFELADTTGWVKRSFSTKLYRDITFRFDWDGYNSGSVSVSTYDFDQFLWQRSVNYDIFGGRATMTPSPSSLWDNLSNFTILFQQQSNTQVYLGHLEIFGTAFTLSPTAASNPTTSNPTTAITPEPTTKDPTLYPTVNPTINPTVNPSSIPTINPSINPTINPTIHPTINPTIHPTQNPTIIPTTNPSATPITGTTSIPSLHPTIYPTTVNPTNIIVIETSTVATIYTTENNDNEVTDIESTQTIKTLTTQHHGANIISTGNDIFWFMIIGIGLIVMCFCVFIGFIYCFRKNKILQKNLEQLESKSTQNQMSKMSLASTSLKIPQSAPTHIVVAEGDTTPEQDDDDDAIFITPYSMPIDSTIHITPLGSKPIGDVNYSSSPQRRAMTVVNLQQSQQPMPPNIEEIRSKSMYSGNKQYVTPNNQMLFGLNVSNNVNTNAIQNQDDDDDEMWAPAPINKTTKGDEQQVQTPKGNQI